MCEPKRRPLSRARPDLVWSSRAVFFLLLSALVWWCAVVESAAAERVVDISVVVSCTRVHVWPQSDVPLNRSLNSLRSRFLFPFSSSFTAELRWLAQQAARTKRAQASSSSIAKSLLPASSCSSSRSPSSTSWLHCRLHCNKAKLSARRAA